MNLLRLSVTFLLILMINLIRIIASDEHRAQPRISSFITRKSKIMQQIENNGLQKLDSSSRHKRYAKPRHLSVHGQKNKSGSKRERNRRQNRSTFGSALYFDGSGQLLQLRSITKQGKITLPDESFTVQFWAKPEGGQGKLTPIIDLFDDCKKKNPSSRWSVGIRTDKHERRNARFMFSLLTEASTGISTLSAHKRYDPNVWTNVAASFDGSTMKLFINGAKISNGHEQKGSIFNHKIAKCKNLIVGGDAVDGSFYRGKIDEVRFWNRALGHEEIVQSMHSRIQEMEFDSYALLMDPFDNLSQWRVIAGTEPDVFESDIPVVTHDIRLEAPPCGQTSCDDPEAVFSYLNNTELRTKKIVRYRIVNILNDEGLDPLVSTKQIQTQHAALNDAFSPYNIEFLPEVLSINNTFLRQRLVMFRCFPHMIGDGHCDPVCAHSSTGNDAGDCDQARTECYPELLGNGICDPECNKQYNDYDKGDCCLPGPNTHLQCMDPNNPLRAFMHVDDLKESLSLDGASQINIYFITAGWQENTFRGLSTFPWEKNVYTSTGGIILHFKNFGKPGKLKALVHEMGHILGLWHVHHGISEMKCDDACAELQPSMVLGDLCSDTNPTPKSRYCGDPIPNPLRDFEETCGIYSFKYTPYHNYMGYADEACTNQFTPQQVARMHCYLDLVYQPMRQMKTQVPVPVAPKVISADPGSLTIVWLEPLGLDRSCDSHNAFHQYADTATSSHNGVRWSPHEATVKTITPEVLWMTRCTVARGRRPRATVHWVIHSTEGVIVLTVAQKGFPDSERCKPSTTAWMPHHDDDFESFDSECEEGDCWLELSFKTQVTPRRLSVWVADIDVEVILSVALVLPAGTELSLGVVPALCDIETTLMIDTKETIDKIRIYTSDKNVAIDAVELVSTPNFPECTKRKSPKYKIERDPPFPGGTVLTEETEFKDIDVEEGTTYSYRIQTLMDAKISELSPKLVYTHGQPFCGDGIVDSGEDCDDKNVLDGDGCSIECRIEENFNCKVGVVPCGIPKKRPRTSSIVQGTHSYIFISLLDGDGCSIEIRVEEDFNCKGNPSLCYVYAWDGVCEEFERELSPSDCGFFTPDGFVDQWASSAVGNPEFQVLECPEFTLVGEPSQLQRCEVYSDSKSWRPCGEFHDTYGHFWIEVFFAQPVVAVSVIIYLGSDGYTPVDTDTKYMRVDLLTPENQTIPVVPGNVPISCRENPIQVPIKQDLSKPFFLTQGARISFTYSSISIAGVRLRSSPFIDPIKLASCSEEGLYNIKTGQCAEQSCSKSVCGPFLVKYGVADCSGSTEGDTCSIICDHGYEVAGQRNEAVCAQGSWIAATSLRCVPVDCRRLKVPLATVACSDGTTYGSECVFKCDKPARLVGNDTNIKCQANGRWSKQQAFCEIRCDPLRLDADNNGKLKTDTCAEKEQEVGQPCKIRCSDGYHVEGERIKKRSLTLICDDDGQWSGPVCVQNQCPAVPVLFSGAYTCSDYLYRRSTCTMSCPGNLEVIQSIKCKINGVWSDQFRICPTLKTESCPSLVSNNEIIVDCKSRTVGEECDISCVDPGLVPIYKRHHDDPYGTKPITYVDSVVCSVMLSWLPNPDRITCVRRCFEVSIGDGFCDAANNQEHCDWDGGDCCPSTVEDGVVITFPEHCPIECKCRDPAAVENKRRRRRHRLHYKELMYSGVTEMNP